MRTNKKGDSDRPKKIRISKSMRKRSLSQFVFFWDEIGKAEKKQEKFSVTTFNKSADIRKNDPRPGIEKDKCEYFPKEIGKWRMVIVYKKRIR